MPASYCPNPNCTVSGFEIKDIKLWHGSRERLIAFVQCRGCGTVVGVLDSPAADQLTGANVKLFKIGQKLGLPSSDLY
jgi:hypothetical protein